LDCIFEVPWDDICCWIQVGNEMQADKMRTCPSYCSSHGNLRSVDVSCARNVDDKMSVTVLLWSENILSQDISQCDWTSSHSCCYLEDNSRPPHYQGDLFWMVRLLLGWLDEHKQQGLIRLMILKSPWNITPVQQWWAWNNTTCFMTTCRVVHSLIEVAAGISQDQHRTCQDNFRGWLLTSPA